MRLRAASILGLLFDARPTMETMSTMTIVERNQATASNFFEQVFNEGNRVRNPSQITDDAIYSPPAQPPASGSKA